MNELMSFNNPEFGEIRTIEIKGNPYFVGRDVAAALGYDEPHKAVARHCKGGMKHPILTEGGRQCMNVIPEGDLYRLIVNSHLPAAEKFERWVFDEVLPSIRKSGKYEAPKQKLRSLGETNSAARIIRQTLKEAGMSPQYVAVAIQSLYAPVGVSFPLDGITVEKRTYDATAIAKRLGLFSKSGIPHGQAVSAIIAFVGCSENEKELVPYQNQTSGHSGANVQYVEAIIPRVRLWLERNGYPETIRTVSKSYSVIYQKNDVA